MRLAIDTSAPTYRKIPSAPSNAHLDFKASKIEPFSAVADGACALIFFDAHQRNSISATIIAATMRNELSIFCIEAARLAASSTAPAANTPPLSITADPR